MNLKDQMVKAGLVSAKQARRTAHQERVDRTQHGAGPAEHLSREISEAAQREEEAQRAKDLELNLARQADAAKREHQAQERDRRQAQIDSALRDGRIQGGFGNRTYCFTDGTRIESLAVSDETSRQISEGKIAIIRSGDAAQPYRLLKAAQALRLIELAPERIVTLHAALP
jgi:hypothetical protein